MSIDRGGLNYPIDVSYDPSGVNQFRSDIAKVKADWKDLKGTLSTGANASIKTSQSSGVSPIAGVSGSVGAVVPAETTRSWSEFFKTLTTGAKESNSAFNSLSNTLERIFVRVVIIEAIREIARGFSSLVGEIISVNSATEQTTLGISSLLLALGNIRTAEGVVADQTTAFALAQQEASKQVKLLRLDALSTATAFDVLAKTFQSAIAPGLQAGLNIDQIRKFTVDISKAATALGVSQSELNVQIRELLSGNITVRDAKIANALGITKADITNAKELGNLVTFLDDRFKAFNTSTSTSLQTFTVIFTNLKDGLGQILASGGLAFFQQLEETFSRLQKVLVTQGPDGVILNPKLVFIAKQFLDVLRDIVKGLDDLVSSVGIDWLLDLAKGFEIVKEVAILAFNNLGLSAKIAADYVVGAFKYAAEQIDLFILSVIGDVISAFDLTGFYSNRAKAAIREYTEIYKQNSKSRQDSINEEILSLKGLGDAVQRMGKAFTTGNAGTSEAPSVSEFFKQLPGIITPVTQSMKDLQGQLTKIKEQSFESNLAFKEGVSVLGTTGTVAAQNKNIFSASLEIHKEIKKNLEEQLEVGVALDGLRKRQSELENTPLGASTPAILLERALVGGKIIAQQSLLNVLKSDELKIEQGSNKVTLNKNALLAAQEAFLLRQSNIIDSIKAANDRAGFNTRFSVTGVQNLVEALGTLRLLQATQAQAQQSRATNIDNLQGQIAALGPSEKRTELERQLVALQEQSNAKLAEEGVLLDKAKEKASDLANQINKPLGTGFVDGIRKAIQGLPSLYQGIVNTIKNIVTGLTDFISTSIVDAFDPTKKQDLQARFAQFLQGIAKQVIDMFVHLALVQAALNLGFLGLGGVPGGGLPGGGGFLGGLVGGASSPAATGLGATVRNAAAQVTNVFNSPLGNIGALNSISTRGFVPSNASVASAYSNRNTPAQTAPASAPGGFHQAVVVASDAHMEQLLAGGKNAQLNFIRTHAGKINSILRTA